MMGFAVEHEVLPTKNDEVSQSFMDFTSTLGEEAKSGGRRQKGRMRPRKSFTVHNTFCKFSVLLGPPLTRQKPKFENRDFGFFCF